MSNHSLRSVLYVDDDPDICEVVQTTLRTIADLMVQTAPSGEAAIALASQHRPDLILMDVMMPGLDGPSTLKRMHECAPVAGIPVIFLTAKVMPSEVTEFLKLGAIGVIGKPFDPIRLCGDILRLWSDARRGESFESRLPPGLEAAPAPKTSLTDGFIERACSDVIRLRKMLECVRAGDESALKEMERVAHSLHGTAAMFGFASVSACGGDLEHLVEDLLMNPSVRWQFESTTLQLLTDRADRLAHEIEAAAISARAPGSGGDSRLMRGGVAARLR